MSATSITTGQTRPDSVGALRRGRGFTLIEMMIVLVIAAILMGIAVPMFEDGLKRNRRLSALESMAGMIATARSEAVSRATTVSICPSTEDAGNCDGTAWELGALLFEDDDQDGVLDGGEELIRVIGAAGAGVTIRSKGGFADDSAIVFNQFGAVDDAGTLVICDADQLPSTATGLVLNASGQARLAVDENNTGIINVDTLDADGATEDLEGCP